MTSIAMILEVGEDLRVAEAQMAFHLLVGVERLLVVVPDDELGVGLRRVCDGDVRVRFVDRLEDARAECRNADWVVEALPGEFWWPRAGELSELLGSVPSRYGTLQALVRPLLAAAHDAGDLLEHSIAREPVSAGKSPPRLRALQRAATARWHLGQDGGPRPGIPLRGWYPFEVLVLAGADVPLRPASEIAVEVASGLLVADTRLRDVMRPFRTGTGKANGSCFRWPAAGERAVLPVPSLVDDAMYALECAVCGENDVGEVRRELESLEERVQSLESGLWRRVERRIIRVLSRPSPSS